MSASCPFQCNTSCLEASAGPTSATNTGTGITIYATSPCPSICFIYSTPAPSQCAIPIRSSCTITLEQSFRSTCRRRYEEMIVYIFSTQDKNHNALCLPFASTCLIPCDHFCNPSILGFLTSPAVPPQYNIPLSHRTSCSPLCTEEFGSLSSLVNGDSCSGDHRGFIDLCVQFQSL